MSARKKLSEVAAATPAQTPAGKKNTRELLALCQSAGSGPLKNGRLEEPIALYSVGKPKKDFFQAFPEPETGYMRVSMIEGGIGGTPREYYVVVPDVLTEIGEMAEGSGIKIHTLVPVIDRLANVRIWPLPDATCENGMRWARSRLKVLAEAKDKWVRMQSNMGESRYDILAAIDQTLPPKWPDLPYGEIVEKALADCFITSSDHPVIQAIVGK